VNGLRKAALYLHSLNEADQHWLLNALSEAEREQLAEVTEELETMGIPKGHAWLPELAETHSVGSGNRLSEALQKACETIDQADLAVITQVFEQEPDWVEALLLKYRVWSWRQSYIGKQYLQKREHLLKLLESPDPPMKAKLQEALLVAFAGRLKQLHSTANTDFEAVLSETEIKAMKSVKGSAWKRLWRR
jgi:hypothetical protein